MNWSSFGSTSAVHAAWYAAFIAEISAFAQIVEQRFAAPVYRLMVTKVDMDKATIRREIAAHVKGMRVGQGRTISAIEGVASGEYDVTLLDDRGYHVTVAKTGIEITRTE